MIQTKNKRIGLDDVIERLPHAQRYSSAVWGLCPFHSDSRPSLKVWGGGYKCVACGANGSLYKLYRVLQGSEFDSGRHSRHHRDTGRSGSAGRGNPLPSYANLPDLVRLLNTAHDDLIASDRLTFYTDKRGITEGIRLYRLGYTNGWYTFPIYDREDKIIGGVARGGSNVKGDVKYYVPFGQPPMLYIPDHFLWEKSKKVYVTFGIIDAVTLTLMGYGAASLSNGQGSFRKELFDGVGKKIFFVPDEWERPAAVSAASQLGFRGGVIDLPYIEGTKDPNDLFMAGRADIINEALDE